MDTKVKFVDIVATIYSGTGILLPKLFQWTFETEGREFAKFLRLLEQFIQTVKSREKFGNRMLF